MGLSRLYLYKLGVETPIPLRDSQKETLREALGEELTFADLLTEFDHAHTIGSDIYQPDGSIAWVTFGDQLTKDKFLQAVARMRRLAAGKHFVKPVMKARVAKEIAKYLNKPAEDLTTKDLVVFADHIQTQKEIPVNSNSMREKLLFELKKEVRHQRLHAKTAEVRTAIYEKYRSNLVTVQPKSLFAQFGAINRTVNSDELLHSEAEQIGTELKELNVDRKKELHAFVDKVLKEVPMSKTMTEPYEHDEAAVEIEQAQQQEVMQEVRQATEQGRKIPLQEQAWPQNLDAPGLFDAVPVGVTKEGAPSVHTLESCHTELKGLFHSNLLISSNALKSFEDNPIPLLTLDQKPLHHLLLVKEADGTTKLVILSLEESKAFVGLLKEEHDRKFRLIEPSGETVKSGINAEFSSPELLIQTLFLQGDAKRLAKEPYIQSLSKWIGQSDTPMIYRNLFERIVSFRSQDLETFLNSKKLQRALIGK